MERVIPLVVWARPDRSRHDFIEGLDDAINGLDIRSEWVFLRGLSLRSTRVRDRQAHTEADRGGFPH